MSEALRNGGGWVVWGISWKGSAVPARVLCHFIAVNWVVSGQCAQPSALSIHPSCIRECCKARWKVVQKLQEEFCQCKWRVVCVERICSILILLQMYYVCNTMFSEMLCLCSLLYLVSDARFPLLICSHFPFCFLFLFFCSFCSWRMLCWFWPQLSYSNRSWHGTWLPYHSCLYILHHRKKKKSYWLSVCIIS